MDQSQQSSATLNNGSPDVLIWILFYCTWFFVYLNSINYGLRFAEFYNKYK